MVQLSQYNVNDFNPIFVNFRLHKDLEVVDGAPNFRKVYNSNPLKTYTNNHII